MRCSNNSLLNIHFPLWRSFLENCSFESVFYFNVCQSTSRKAYIWSELRAMYCCCSMQPLLLTFNHSLVVIQKITKLTFAIKWKYYRSDVAAKCSINGIKTTDQIFWPPNIKLPFFATFNREFTGASLVTLSSGPWTLAMWDSHLRSRMTRES